MCLLPARLYVFPVHFVTGVDLREVGSGRPVFLRPRLFGPEPRCHPRRTILNWSLPPRQPAPAPEKRKARFEAGDVETRHIGSRLGRRGKGPSAGHSRITGCPPGPAPRGALSGDTEGETPHCVRDPMSLEWSGRSNLHRHRETPTLKKEPRRRGRASRRRRWQQRHWARDTLSETTPQVPKAKRPTCH